MAVEPDPLALVAIIPLSAVVAPVNCWLTYRMFLEVKKLLWADYSVRTVRKRTVSALTTSSPKSVSSVADSSFELTAVDVAPSARKSANISAKQTLIWSLCCSAGMTLSCLIVLIRASLFYNRVHHSLNDSDHLRKVQRQSDMTALWAVISILQGGSYMLLLTTVFCRLIQTFQRSQWKLGESTIRNVSVMIGLLFTIVLIAGVTSPLNTWVFRFCALISAVLYPSLFLWITRRFFINTRIIERNLRDGHSDHSSSNTKSLLQASLRLSILSTVAILSSLILGITLGLAGFIQTTYFSVLTYLMVPIDGLINNYALLCTFRGCLTYYDFVFGCIHRYFERILND